MAGVAFAGVHVGHHVSEVAAGHRHVGLHTSHKSSSGSSVGGLADPEFRRLAKEAAAAAREKHIPHATAHERPVSHALSARSTEALKLRHTLDKWVCDFHLYLTLGAGLVFGSELAVGATFCVLEWSSPENKAIRVFLVMRLVAYAFVMQASRQELKDYEPAHPGMHVTWTFIHTICIVTISLSSRHTFRTWQSVVVVAMIVIDNGILAVTWFGLRSVRRRILRHISDGEIDSIHEATWRYLDFMPRQRSKDAPSARHLLWADVKRFEDINLDDENDAYLERRRNEAQAPASVDAATSIMLALDGRPQSQLQQRTTSKDQHCAARAGHSGPAPCGGPLEDHSQQTPSTRPLEVDDDAEEGDLVRI